MRWILAVLSVIATVSLFMPLHYHRFGNLSRFWMLVFKVVPTAICAAFGVSATGELISGGELKETSVEVVRWVTTARLTLERLQRFVGMELRIKGFPLAFTNQRNLRGLFWGY